MATERPYMQLSLDALRAKLGDSPGSKVLLEEVRHELAFRTTPGAKRLEREVVALLAGACPQALASMQPLGKAQTSTSDGDRPAPTSAPLSDMESRYIALRATFTAEAEILSRWGMTSLAPPPLRDAVFRHWQETLLDSVEQHPLGLSREDLERDLDALKNEKRGS